MVLGVVWLLATRRVPWSPSNSEQRIVAWSRLFRSRSLLLLTLSYAAIGYFQYLFFYWMHYYFVQVLNLGKTESRFYAAFPVLAMAMTMPLGGWLSGRMQARHGWRAGRVFVAGGAMVGAVVFLIAGIMPVNHLWTVFCFTMALGALGLSEAAFWQTAVELGGALGGTAAAFMNTGGNGIGLLAPVVTPWVANKLGWQSGIAVGGVVCLLGAVCWLCIRPAQGTNGEQLYEPN
ncbi:MAG: MFS transporter [Phycisphaerales bacterium]|nr:MFS transporter [Phycisphaerales bacterium]